MPAASKPNASAAAASLRATAARAAHGARAAAPCVPHLPSVLRPVEALESRVLFAAGQAVEPLLAVLTAAEGGAVRTTLRPSGRGASPVATTVSATTASASGPSSVSRPAPAPQAVEAEGAGGFQIQVVFTDNNLTASQRAIFNAAADRWEQILTGELSDVNFNGGVIDDLRIEASAPPIDGAGGVLGQAGPTRFRSSNDLPYYGIMEFDSADVANLESQNRFDEVILHEMGHVLGVGTIWSFKDLLTGAGGSNPRFTGARAVAEYRAVFGVTTSTVPVENSGGSGTRDAHWREGTVNSPAFANELMTGFLNFGSANPISRVTIAQFADLGYPGVNVNAFDAYTPPGGGNPPPTVGGGLSASPGSSQPGASFTLTANNVADGGGGSVANVKFYRETNGVPGLQVLLTPGGASDPGGDLLLGQDDAAGPFNLSVSTAGLSAGTYTYYALAQDNQNLHGATVQATHTLASNSPPTVTSLADQQDPVAPGGTVVLTATGVSDPDGPFAGEVRFYRESNGTAGLQPAADTLLGADASGADGYTLNASAAGLAAGTYTYYAQAVDSAGAASNVVSTNNTVVPPDTTAPRVTGVYVDSTAWNDHGRAFLDSGGIGSSALGFRMLSGPGQLAALPYRNANRLRVVFSEDVSVQQNDLAVRGVDVAEYAFAAVDGFAYDSANFVATWTLAADLGADKLLLDLNGESNAGGGVTDGTNLLDGDWSNGAGAFPGGDGTAGGDFRFQINVLPGDADGSGTVDVADLGVVATNFNSAPDPRGPRQGDFNGDASVDVGDLGTLATNFGRSLPGGTPGAPASALVTSTPTRAAFSSSFPRPAPALFGTRSIRMGRRPADLLA